jgi:heme exporter protein C
VSVTHQSLPAAVPRQPRWVTPLGIIGLLAVIAAQVHGFTMSPPDRDMGNLQKIMYVHVPAAWMSFICFFVVLVGSIRYLWKRTEGSDLLAASAAEVGAVMTALTLLLGSIWGRPTWGVWWTWDARLTSTAVLLVIFVGYLALRSFTDDPERRANWSAAVGIFGALNVPIVYMSVKWWRTLHQLPSSPNTLDPAYTLALRLNAIAALLLVIYVIATRFHVARLEAEADARAEREALAFDDRGSRDSIEVAHV